VAASVQGTAAEPKVDIAALVKEEFRRDTETRDAPTDGSHLADRLELILSDYVEVGGYFRAGYARSGAGGAMAPFQAPGAASKYRLGNEAENYGELILGKNFYMPGVFKLEEGVRPDGSLKGAVARVQVRLSFLNPYSASGSADATQVGLPEAWAAIGNVFPKAPSLKVWAGNRFYRRHDIHVTDFIYWNVSGGGGGIEDIPVGKARMALAWIGWGSTSGLSYLPQPDPENRAGFSKQTFDLRLYDLALLNGHAEVGLAYAHAMSGIDETGTQGPEGHGFAAAAVHTIPGFISEDGVQKLSVQFGTGPARTFTAGFETVTLPTGTFINPEENDAFRFRVTENFTANLHRNFSIGPVIVFQMSDDGTPDTNQLWLSAGVRPIVHLTRHLSVAFEGGVDWTKSASAGEGTLAKLTVAPQVSISDRWASRPVIRAFMTGAFWSDGFMGQVGGLDYATSTDGLSGGMQMEAWW
jgi:maltoporin